MSQDNGPSEPEWKVITPATVTLRLPNGTLMTVPLYKVELLEEEEKKPEAGKENG